MMNWKEFVSRLCATMSVTGYGILFFVAINSWLSYYYKDLSWDYIWSEYKDAIILGSLMATFSWIIHGLTNEHK